MTVGEKIRVLRLQEKWSQKRLAIELGVSETTIRNYEAGRVSVREKHMQKLAQIFDVDISALGENKIASYNDVMQLLFMLEDEYGLATSNIEHVLPDDAVLVFNKRTLQEYINVWHKKRNELERANSDKEELQAWELKFPQSCTEDSQSMERETLKLLK